MGNSTQLLQITAAGGTITDRSGTAYNATDTLGGLWSWSQFGAITLAINKFDTLQAATTGSGSFAAVSGAPKASVVMTVGGPTSPFAMLLNYNDGTDTPDGIFWSALADYTNWTPSTATQCGNVRMYEPVGPLIAGIKFRDGAIAWKEDAMFVGTFIGPPTVWQWQRVASDCGCAAKYLNTSSADKVFFADKRGVWMFDGSYPQLIPGYMQDYWAQVMYPDIAASPAKAQMVWDPIKHNLWVGTNTNFLVWNAISGLWTRHANIANAGTISSLFVISFAPTPLVIYTNGAGQYVDSLTYTAASAATGPVRMTLAFMGDPIKQSLVKRVAPVWISTIAAAQVPDAAANVTSAAFSSMPAGGVNGSLSNTGAQSHQFVNINALSRYFDVMESGNFHRVHISNWNNGEFRDVVVDIQQNGTA